MTKTFFARTPRLRSVVTALAGLILASVACEGQAPVVGYADLHVHQFTNEALAGAWLYGKPTGPMPTALARCNGNVPGAPGRSHGTIDKPKVLAVFGLMGFLAAQLLLEDQAGADTGLHAGRRHGYCQANVVPGPGLCEGNLACNTLGSSNCQPTHVCEWRSIGSACRDKPGDGISVGGVCNAVGAGKCNDTCHWEWPLCRGNAACNTLGKSKCNSNVCEMQSLGSICRDRDGDGKSVGLVCNTLGQSACGASCAWDASWGSVTLHAEKREHDWTDRHVNNRDKASWPAWRAIAHQQVHTSWLKQAYDDGLRLMVMSALSNEAFCELLPDANRAPGYGCGDVENVARQLNAAIALDNDASVPWYQIAYSAAQARAIINANKLAVVLSVEASDIFNRPNPVVNLQGLYNHGVRTLQPLHQFNSRLGGVAFHEGSIKLIQTVKNLPSLRHLCKDKGGYGSYAACDATKDQLNYLGLTEDGMRFVNRMLNLGMPVDISHMSERSVRDVENIVSAACDYPVYISHGHVRTLLDEGSWKANKKHEKTTPDWQLDLVRKTGGMFGLRTGSDYHHSTPYNAAMLAAGLSTSLKVTSAVDMGNGNPGGHEVHFAYALDYLFRVKGVNVALGSDFNGLIEQMVFSGEEQDEKLAGLAHIGKLPVMFGKLAAQGLDSGTLNQLKQGSAEAYLRMWERATAFAGGKACCPTPVVSAAIPAAGWYGRPTRITVHGAGYTPHASLQVFVRPVSGLASKGIPCTNVEFLASSTDIRCTLPPLKPGTWYTVIVRNGGCNLEGSKKSAYFASPIDGGPIVDPPPTPFVQSELRTALADVIPSNGWLAPNAEKIGAVDWTHPVWDEFSPPTSIHPADRPIEDGYPQGDWDALAKSPRRRPISPALDVLLGREDAALMSDPFTMIAACDQGEEMKLQLAAANAWPADWRAQMNSLCDWQGNVCVRGSFSCPGGAVIERVGQVTDATTASCPFDVGATYAICPGTDNLAMGSLASFSVAPAAGGEAWRALDNSTRRAFADGSVAMTGSTAAAPWWQVDLGSNATIHAVSLYNRTDCCAHRLKQFHVQTSTDGVRWQNQFLQKPAIAAVANFVLPSPVVTRYVRLQFFDLSEPVNLAEVQVWGSRARGLPGSNIAIDKPAAFGSGYYSCHAANAVNGNLAGTTTTAPGCTTAISGNSFGAWWQVDLGAGSNTLSAVRIWNRQDCALAGCIDRLRRFTVQTSNDGVDWTTQVDHPATLFTVNQQVETVVFPAAAATRYVRIKFEPTYQNFLQLNEVEVLGASRAR